MIIPTLALSLTSLEIVFNPIILLFFLFWYGILSLIAVAPFYDFLVWKNIWYVLTSKGIIVRKGLIGIDYDFLNLENIQQVNVNVSLLDKKYNTGSIVLQSVGVKPLILWAVENPYKVQEIIREAIEEAKDRK